MGRRKKPHLCISCLTQRLFNPSSLFRIPSVIAVMYRAVDQEPRGARKPFPLLSPTHKLHSYYYVTPKCLLCKDAMQCSSSGLRSCMSSCIQQVVPCFWIQNPVSLRSQRICRCANGMMIRIMLLCLLTCIRYAAQVPPELRMPKVEGFRMNKIDWVIDGRAVTPKCCTT